MNNIKWKRRILHLIIISNQHTNLLWATNIEECHWKIQYNWAKERKWCHRLQSPQPGMKTLKNNNNYTRVVIVILNNCRDRVKKIAQWLEPNNCIEKSVSKSETQSISLLCGSWRRPRRRNCTVHSILHLCHSVNETFGLKTPARSGFEYSNFTHRSRATLHYLCHYMYESLDMEMNSAWMERIFYCFSKLSIIFSWKNVILLLSLLSASF